MDLASKLFKGDRVIWIIFMFLCLISVVEVFSATSTIAYKNANHWAPIVRHATFLLGGFVMVLLLHNVLSMQPSMSLMKDRSKERPFSLVAVLFASHSGFADQ